MNGDLKDQMHSGCWTVGKERGVTLENTVDMKETRVSLPVLSVFVDWGTATRGATSKICYQRGGVLSEMAEPDTNL